MCEYYKIPIVILDKNNLQKDNKIDIQIEYIIAKKTIHGYREIINNITFVKKSALKNINDIKHQDTKKIIDKDILEKLEKYGVYFIVDKSFDNLAKLAIIPEVKNYLDNFEHSKFKMYYDKYKSSFNEKVEKQDKRQIKKLIKDFKK